MIRFRPGFAKSSRTPGTPNKTEAAYADYLEAQKMAGDVLWYRFEPLKLRIGKGAYYTPDFAVINDQGGLYFVEVKGFWREAARVRIKVAADAFPHFLFIAVQRKGKQWAHEEF